MKRLPTRKIRNVVRLFPDGLSTHEILTSLSIGHTTLQGYLERASEAGLRWPLLRHSAIRRLSVWCF